MPTSSWERYRPPHEPSTMRGRTVREQGTISQKDFASAARNVQSLLNSLALGEAVFAAAMKSGREQGVDRQVMSSITGQG
jgi:hypothetical protein